MHSRSPPGGTMLERIAIGAMALTAALATTMAAAPAFDDSKYPNLKGQWLRERPPAGVTGQGPFDPVKSRGRQGPRTFEPSGMPLHADNNTVVKERIFLDKADPNLLHNQMTVIDSALTRPWAVEKKYRRDKAEQPLWPEDVCADGQAMVRI